MRRGQIARWTRKIEAAAARADRHPHRSPRFRTHARDAWKWLGRMMNAVEGTVVVGEDTEEIEILMRPL